MRRMLISEERGWKIGIQVRFPIPLIRQDAVPGQHDSELLGLRTKYMSYWDSQGAADSILPVLPRPLRPS